MDREELDRLYDGFARRDRAVVNEFFDLLMRAVRREMKRWRSLPHRQDEIESQVYETIAEWEAQGILRREPIVDLASRLVHQAARQESRDYEREKEGLAKMAAQEMGETDVAADAEKELSGAEIEAQIGRLMSGMKSRYQAVLAAHKAFEEGAGPPIGEALGMTQASARKLLSLARTELIELIVTHELELPAEWRLALAGEGKAGDG